MKKCLSCENFVGNFFEKRDNLAHHYAIFVYFFGLLMIVWLVNWLEITTHWHENATKMNFCVTPCNAGLVASFLFTPLASAVCHPLNQQWATDVLCKAAKSLVKFQEIEAFQIQNSLHSVDQAIAVATGIL